MWLPQHAASFGQRRSSPVAGAGRTRGTGEGASDDMGRPGRQDGALDLDSGLFSHQRCSSAEAGTTTTTLRAANATSHEPDAVGFGAKLSSARSERRAQTAMICKTIAFAGAVFDSEWPTVL